MNESNGQENDVLSLLKRMQQQLAFLEKKMDTLIQQTQQKAQPFNRAGGNWRPKPPWQSRGQGQDRPREGNFAPKKKPFFGHGHGREHR